MPLLWLSLAFLVGVIAGGYAGWPVLVWAVLAAGFLLFFILRALAGRILPAVPPLSFYAPSPEGFPHAVIPVPLLLLVFACGGLCYQIAQPRLDAGQVAWYNDQGETVVLQGVLVEPPDVRDQALQLKIRSELIYPQAGADGIPVEGLLLARLGPGGDWRYGDRLQLEGALVTPSESEEFSYKDYLSRQGVYAYMAYPTASLVEHTPGNRFMAAIYALKGRALHTIYRQFPDPEASLMAGILLGVEAGIPPDVRQAFQDTGTAHIIAISGFNMAIVAGLFAGLFGRLLGRRKGAVAAVIAIALYTLLVGANAAVVRAAIMGGLGVFAAQVGRRQSGLNTLVATAAVMALFDPDVLWDASFQLSFLATLGLILYADPLMDWFAGIAGRWLAEGPARRLAGYVGEYFLFTIAASLVILPASVYYFQRISPSALLANPAVLPAQPPLMVLGGLAMILGLVSPPLGQAAALLAWPFPAYTIRAVERLAGMPGSAIVVGKPGAAAIAAFYLALFGITFGWPAWRRWQLARKAQAQTAPADAQPSTPQPSSPSLRGRLNRLGERWLPAGVLGLAALAVVAWRLALNAPDSRLHLTVLDVGGSGSSGEGLLIQTPGGRSLLVNGGPGPARLSDALGRRLPLDRRSLDFVVVAGGEDEQLQGLAGSLERFPPEQVLWAGPSGGSRAARALRQELADLRIPLVEAHTGQILELGDGARLHVLSANRRGAVLLLEWDNFRALLPIGLDVDSLESLQKDRSLDGVTALLLASSGYAPLNPPGWIARLRPQVALLSVASGDRRNLPDAEVIEAVEGYTLLRTDLNGWIELSTDGEQMWVEVEKPPAR